MKLTHYGHAAVLVETAAGSKVLIDPGNYSQGYERIDDLDLLLVTHSHPDHLDTERFQALRDLNPEAVLVANADTSVAAGNHREGDRMVLDDSAFEIAGIGIEPTGRSHAEIANTGFVVDGTVWHPGDAFDALPRQVEILLLPVGGPWMKIGEAIDFARAVAPRVIVPIHQGGLAEVHRNLHYGLLRNLVAAEFVILEEGVTREF